MIVIRSEEGAGSGSVQTPSLAADMAEQNHRSG
jgi:hypothetical protein